MTASLRIFVVDDDQIDRLALRRALEQAGIRMDFSEAEDYATAIATLQNCTFDCVFLDYRLPDRDGLTLLHELHANGIKIPGVALTGYGDEELAVDWMKAGAYDYLPKSKLSPEVLKRIVYNTMRLYRAEMQILQTHQQVWQSNELLRNKNQELKEQQQKIELQHQKLLELSQLKSHFLASMSHELRTPLNAIMGFSQILIRQSTTLLSKQQFYLVERILYNSQNLLIWIDEILGFSQINLNSKPFKLEKFNLKTLMFRTSNELRSLAADKNLLLRVNVDLKQPEIINDRSHFRQILRSLICNAIQATETEAGSIQIEARELNLEQITILIQNSGLTLTSQDLPTLFQPFHPVYRPLTRRSSVTGLELAITESLIQQMQGTITVESDLDKGSLFKIIIPRRVENQYTDR